jgi:hypothetical protein
VAARHFFGFFVLRQLFEPHARVQQFIIRVRIGVIDDFVARVKQKAVMGRILFDPVPHAGEACLEPVPGKGFHHLRQSLNVFRIIAVEREGQAGFARMPGVFPRAVIAEQRTHKKRRRAERYQSGEQPAGVMVGDPFRDPSR